MTDKMGHPTKANNMDEDTVIRRNRGAGSGASPAPFPYPSASNINISEPLLIDGEAPVGTIQSKLKLPTCEMCGKTPNHTLHSHHVIPRYMECSDDGDIIQVCKTCHRRADSAFDRLILDPFGRSRGCVNWADPKKKKELAYNYKKDHIWLKKLFTYCNENINAETNIHVNARTGEVFIYNTFSTYGLKEYRKETKNLFNMSFDNGVMVGVSFFKFTDNEPRIFTYWRYRKLKTIGRSQTDFVKNKRGHFTI